MESQIFKYIDLYFLLNFTLKKILSAQKRGVEIIMWFWKMDGGPKKWGCNNSVEYGCYKYIYKIIIAFNCVNKDISNIFNILIS